MEKKGDIANGKYLQEFIYEKLTEAYGNKGYVLYSADFELEFIEPQAEGLDGIVNLIFNIDEGRQFKVTIINFTGINEEAEKKLKEILSIKKGEVYNQSKLEEGIKKINGLKEFVPIDKDQDIETRTMWDESDISILIKTRRLTENERKYYRELFEGRN